MPRSAIRSVTAVAVALAFAWSVISAIIAVFVFVMVRERYGRRGPFSADDALQLLNPQRRWLHSPVNELLQVFRVRPGDTVLELGPGPGYFSIEASGVVGPSGRVLCIDIQRGMISVLAQRLREAPAPNAHALVGDATSIPLADGSVDAAFLVTVLGEIQDRPGALIELRRVLKPGGVLSVMEGMNDPDYQLEASVRDLCRATGFRELGRRGQRLGYIRLFAAG